MRVNINTSEQLEGIMTDNKQTRYIPVSKWKNDHLWPSEGGLRHLIFHSKTNGFDKVVVRVGRNVLIDESAFFEWVDGHKKPTAMELHNQKILKEILGNDPK